MEYFVSDIEIAAQKKFLAEHPEVVVDLFDTYGQQWATLAYNPASDQYSTGLIYDLYAGQDYEEKKLGYDLAGAASGLAGSLASSGVGAAMGLLEYYKKSTESDRKKLGEELWEKDPSAVAGLASKTREWMNTMAAIVSDRGTNKSIRDAAFANLKSFNDLYARVGIPTINSWGIERLGASLGIGWDELGFKDAVDKAAISLGNSKDQVRFGKEVARQLDPVRGEVATVKNLAEAIKKQIDLQVEAEALAQTQAEFEQSLGEFRGYGVLLGTLVGITDRKTGAAVTTVFDTAATLYSAYHALSAAGAVFTMATFATGAGAAVALFGAIAGLGSSGSPDSTQVMLGAIRGLYTRIDELAAQMRDQHKEVLAKFKDLNTTLVVGLAGVQGQLGDTLLRLQQLHTLGVRIANDNIHDDLTALQIASDLATTHDDCSRTFKSLYTFAVTKANNVSTTGESIGPCQHVLAIRTRFQWNFLEEIPILFTIASRQISKRLGYVGEAKAGTDAEDLQRRLRVDYGLEEKFRRHIQNSETISIAMLAETVGIYTELFRLTHLRPDLRPINSPPAFTYAEMLLALETMLRWPMRATSIFGKLGVLGIFQQDFLKAVAAFVSPTLRYRVSTVSRALVHPSLEAAALLGAVAYVRFDGSKIFDLSAPPEGISDADKVSISTYIAPEPPVAGYSLPPNTLTVFEFLHLLACFGRLNPLVQVREFSEASVEFWRPSGNSIAHVAAETGDNVHGMGDYFGLFELSVGGYPGPNDNYPVSYFSIRDMRRMPIPRQYEGEPTPVVSKWLEPKRGQFEKWSVNYDSTKSLCPGPYDDLAFEALQSFLDELHRTPMGGGGDTFRQKFLALREELRFQKIELVLSSAPDTGGLAGLYQDIVSVARSRDLAASNQKTKIVEVESLQDLQTKWLGLAVSAACYAEETGNFEPLSGMLKTVPPILERDQSINLTESTEWQHLTGPSLARILALWRPFEPEAQSDASQLFIAECDEENLTPNLPSDLLSRRMHGIGIRNNFLFPLEKYYDLPDPIAPAMSVLPRTRQALTSLASLKELIEWQAAWKPQ